MTRGELVAAAQRSGANHLDEGDVQRFVDEAVREFDAEELWPWRVIEATGSAPLAVTTLGPIDSVRDSERRPIWPRRHSELVEERRDLTATGNARYYYVEAGVVHTWPISVLPITVRYHDQGGWTTGDEEAGSDADTPRADERWHDAILHLVKLRCRMEDRDQAGATMEWERYQARLEQARQAELRDNHDEPDVIRVREVY